MLASMPPREPVRPMVSTATGTYAGRSSAAAVCGRSCPGTRPWAGRAPVSSPGRWDRAPPAAKRRSPHLSCGTPAASGWRPRRLRAHRRVTGRALGLSVARAPRSSTAPGGAGCRCRTCRGPVSGMWKSSRSRPAQITKSRAATWNACQRRNRPVAQRRTPSGPARSPCRRADDGEAGDARDPSHGTTKTKTQRAA